MKDRIIERSQDVQESTQRFINQRPAQAIAVAAGAGILLSACCCDWGDHAVSTNPNPPIYNIEEHPSFRGVVNEVKDEVRDFLRTRWDLLRTELKQKSAIYKSALPLDRDRRGDAARRLHLPQRRPLRLDRQRLPRRHPRLVL